MQTLIKIFFWGAMLLVVAFLANYYELVSIPWLDVNDVATYSDDAVRTNSVLEKVFKK
jgi:hypothetical protein